MTKSRDCVGVFPRDCQAKITEIVVLWMHGGWTVVCANTNRKR